MKTLVLLSLSLAVALGRPPFSPGVAEKPVLKEDNQSPLVGDWVPVQGHVEVEHPAPQARLSSREQQEKLTPVDVEQSPSEVEPEVKVEQEVKEEKELKSEPEVEVEQEWKEESEVQAEPEVQVEPEVEMEQELKPGPDFKVEPEVQVEPEPVEEPTFKEVQQEFQVQMNLETEPDPGLMTEEKPDDLEKTYEMPIVELEPLDDDNMFGDEMNDAELLEVEKSMREAFQSQEADVEPEVQVEPEPVEEPTFKEVQQEFQVQMNLETEPDPGLMTEEKAGDLEKTYEMPIVELEPLDDDNVFEDEMNDAELLEVEKSMREAFQSQEADAETLPEEEEKEEEGPMWKRVNVLDEEPLMELEPELTPVEKSMREAFQSQDAVPETLPEEEKEVDGLMWKSENVLDEVPIMELEPEMEEEQFQNQDVAPDAAILDEGPALDIMGQQMSLSGNYFPNEEARMEMWPEKQEESFRADELDYGMMEGEGGQEESPVEFFEDPEMDDHAVLDGGAEIGVEPKRKRRDLLSDGVQNHIERGLAPNHGRQGGSCCPGVVLDRKCYRFFRGPLRAADAELFCQQHFPGGHLASITSQYNHRQLMEMMRRQNGKYTRTWVGGLRYLDTGRFIWLDGARWDYADWLSGEPNDTVGVEDCLEVLALGDGKFNDFTCWEPQAFICSYPH